jgi:Xaa-Pro aminopeptidase
MFRCLKKEVVTSLFVLFALYPSIVRSEGFPAVLDIADRIRVVNDITKKRLDVLLPRFMTETGFDMWIILGTEDNYDPVFDLMVPMDTWCPLIQMLVFYQKEPGGEVERLSLARNTNMKGLHEHAWDYRAYDQDKKENQWECLARIVRERDPKRIAINEAEVAWAADGLTVTMKRRLVDTIGPQYAERLHSAEKLATLWIETLLDEELELCERAHVISHAIIAEAFSSEVITPGVTTTDDISHYYWQRAAYLGLRHFGSPPKVVIRRHPDLVKKYGRGDNVIRRGDLVFTDTGIEYLRYHTDSREWAYVLRPGETDVPEGYKRVMAEVHKLQDVFISELEVGLTGNQLLKKIRTAAEAKGLSDFQIYSHSLGLLLHEPGPLIGLPWGDGQEVGTPRGDVELVYNSTMAAEMNLAYPVPEWGGAKLRMQLENGIAITEEGVRWLDRRQTNFYIVK